MAVLLMEGRVGSGKTAYTVKWMAERKEQTFYTNIKTDLPNCVLLDSSMICTKTLLGVQKNGKKLYELKPNFEYWKSVRKPISVVIDEAHNIINSRRSMSKVNIAIGEWLALLRRVLGEDSQGTGDLILISQQVGKIDVNCRDAATNITHFRCHFVKECQSCHAAWREHSDFPEPIRECPCCGSHSIKRDEFVLHLMSFSGMKAFIAWEVFGERSYYKNVLVPDIQDYFGHYDTLQMENLLSDLYL